jgi:glycosyltransferase involved in cell wall biosynthesis
VKYPRVFIVIATFHPMVGGAEKQAFSQGQSLRRRGIEATIVTFHHNWSWPAHEMIDGVPIIRIAGLLLGRREKLPRILQKLLYLLALLVMGWKLWLYRHRYDVLHVYQLNLIVLPTALACYLSSKPMIVAVRATDSGKREKSQKQGSHTAGLLNANSPMLRIDENAKAMADLNDLERMGKPLVRFTHDLLQRIHAVVIILSSRMKDYLITHDFTLHNVQLIPNGVDISHFAPINTDVSQFERNQIVICTARLCYQKGIDILIQAWYLVHQEMPQARLIIAGIGPLQPQLECMVRELGLIDSIEFVGLQRDVLALLHQCSIAVLSSRWEGMSNALLEAMACGLPCVATRISGSEDIIQDGINGLLVESEDYHNLAKAILTLLRDPELARKIGSAARSRIEQHYSLDRISDIYVELYRRIASSKCQSAEDKPSSEFSRSPL